MISRDITRSMANTSATMGPHEPPWLSPVAPSAFADRNPRDGVQAGEIGVPMPSIKNLKAFNFQAWIDANKEKFKPPVGNAQVWEDGEMMVTVVGGPNQRRDYHDDPTEEFFYQLKGNISLRIMETPGRPPIEVPIKEGEIFLLPKHMRHSPQRRADTIGVVVEMPRPDGVLDGR